MRGRERKLRKLVRHVRGILETLTEDSSDVSRLDLTNTPDRVARMFLDELVSSQPADSLKLLDDTFTLFPCGDEHQELVVEGPIPFSSLCAHHLLPFVGEAWVGYIPDQHLVGLSKLVRAVQFFARRLQMQELMTSEIADYLMDRLSPRGVILYTSARHFCMESRGVRTPGVFTKVSALRGIAMDAHVKAEFLKVISLR